MEGTNLEKLEVRSLPLERLREAFVAMGFEKYRADQVFCWLHTNKTHPFAKSFDEMSNLPKTMRERLSQECDIAWAQPEIKRVSKDGTVKFLFRLNDGTYVESVVMNYHYGSSICISTQVGCKMGCTFCATGQMGFTRNLSAGEILSQVQSAENETGLRLSHVVLMGMGEPLDNYENVLRFLELVTSPDGMNLSMRHISLSTCGLVDRIYDLADRRLQLTLSVSLHAPNDEIRSRTMPVSKRWSIAELLSACKYYADKTGRRISFEYAMIRGVNDTDACARELAQRLRGILSHVNLIPVNDVTGTGYEKSGLARQKQFISILESRGIAATVRRTLGSDIEASCGQLKGKYKAVPEERKGQYNES